MLTTFPFVYNRSCAAQQEEADGEDSSEDDDESDSQDGTSTQPPILCSSGPGHHRSSINLEMIAFMMTRVGNHQTDVDVDFEPQDPARSAGALADAEESREEE